MPNENAPQQPTVRPVRRADQTGSVDTTSGLPKIESVQTEEQLAAPLIAVPVVEVTDPVVSNLERDLLNREVPGQVKKADADADALDGNVGEVLAYAKDHPDEVEALLAAEKASDSPRKGVLEGLAEIGASPLDGNTDEVLAYAEANPDEVEALLADEKASDKPRKGVIEGLTSLVEAAAAE